MSKSIWFNVFTRMILSNRDGLRLQPRNKLLQLSRQRSIDCQRLAGLRMRELKMRCVEKVPLQPNRGLLGWMLNRSFPRRKHDHPRRAVQRIANHRMPERLHVRSEERRVGKECRSRWSP